MRPIQSPDFPAMLNWSACKELNFDDMFLSGTPAEPQPHADKLVPETGVEPARRETLVSKTSMAAITSLRHDNDMKCQT
jgi:hypothetical protein